ncbi:bifunctional DNA primase/polymerase [uncultured Mycobacterium sp.]|uniref:bifunctional DNA primase/polymerase n=1 Tax=uncultured Mycobacterium sp. TaxID=171292 RepID=UPI0035CC70BD
MAGLSLLDAALAYADAGCYLLPTDPNDVKNPGSVVHGRWQDQSTRDPDQIRRWWTANPNCGIALHCGRSGLIAFDLDIDDLDQISRDGHPEIATALRNAGAIHLTRRTGDRGHYLFLTHGEQFGNSAGLFMRWGQVRGKNGVIVLAPTPHPDADTKGGDYPDADTKGGDYSWGKAEDITPLPDVLRECLSEAADCADPLTDAELDTFLDTYTGGGCGRAGCRHTVSGPVARFRGEVENGAGRHDSLVKVAPWAMSEAMAGCYSAREAFGVLYSAYKAEFTDADDRARVSQLGDEFTRIIKWAAAQADPERAHRNDLLPTEAELEAFWSARPELERLRTFARARCVGPWSTLGAVLARVIATIPPHVVLPPTVGSEASLNLFVALVARSGFGKNTSEAVAEDFVASHTYVFVATPGSGEGILKQYAYNKQTEQINLRNSVMFSVPEIDTFAALTARGGSTLMPELRKAWMGERLGFGWANVEKAVIVMGHRYRMTMIVGVQPGRAKALLQEADGGTPQRFIWLPTTDRDAPDAPPAEPKPLRLSDWPSPGEPKPEAADTGTDADDGLTVKFGSEVDEFRLDVPADKSEFHVLELPPSVVETIRREQRAKLRGKVSETQALDAHATLARLKVAVGLMWMNGRTDKVSEEDWDLAGVVMGVSNATRTEVQAALKTKARLVNQERGRQEGERALAAEAVVRNKAITRVAEGICRKLREQNDRTLNQIKKCFSSADRQYVEPALESLRLVGAVEVKGIEYQGNDGYRFHLAEGR